MVERGVLSGPRAKASRSIRTLKEALPVAESIGDLASRCGRPQWIIDNETPRHGYVGCTSSVALPDMQVKHGSTEFLAVRARRRLPFDQHVPLLRQLHASGHQIIKVQTAFEQVWSRGTKSVPGWVSVVTARDVEPLGLGDLRRAIREGRVVTVSSHRVMGDEYGAGLWLVDQAPRGGACNIFMFPSAVVVLPPCGDQKLGDVVEEVMGYLDR